MTGDAKWFTSTFEKIHVPQGKQVKTESESEGRLASGWLEHRAAVGVAQWAGGALTCLSAQTCPTASMCRCAEVLF